MFRRRAAQGSCSLWDPNGEYMSSDACPDPRGERHSEPPCAPRTPSAIRQQGWSVAEQVAPCLRARQWKEGSGRVPEFVLSPRFCCDPETALKQNYSLKKMAKCENAGTRGSVEPLPRLTSLLGPGWRQPTWPWQPARGLAHSKSGNVADLGSSGINRLLP